MEKIVGGMKYTQEGKIMNMRNLVSVMKSNPEALALITEARNNYAGATVLGGIGGALIGFPIGSAIGGGDPNWLLAGIGAILVVITIPMSSNVNKKTKAAVDLYNSSLGYESFHANKTEFLFVANNRGIGFSIYF